MKFFDILSEFFPNDTEIRDFMLEHTQSLEIKKEDIISREGGYNRNIYFVEEGLLRLFYFERYCFYWLCLFFNASF